MTLLNLTWRFIAVATVLVACPVVLGQGRDLPNGPVYHPFADPLEFDPDWQFFAPVDVDSLMEVSPRKRAPTGWYATYDRTHLWVSRPHTEASADSGDFGWGNRFDVGFMTSEDTGWLVGFRSITGPNTYDSTYQERINRFNEDDVNDPADPVLPSLDANDPQLGTRAYILDDSLNVAGLTSFELNKTWRMEPYRYGGILEPMVGFRYSTFNDTALNEQYLRSGNLITDPANPSDELVVETLITDRTNIRNQMIGGQLGFRYFTHYKRWTLSSEFRAFAMNNFQKRHYEQRTFTTEYDGTGEGADTVATDFSTGTGFVHTTNTEFTFGFEARAEAAYQFTRHIGIRGGVDVINFAKGIWRGANPNFGDAFVQDQDVQMAGFTFGLQVNR